MTLCKGCTAGYSGIAIAVTGLIVSIVPAILIITDIGTYFLYFLLAGVLVIAYELQSKRIIPRFIVRFFMGIMFVLYIHAIWFMNSWLFKYLMGLSLFIAINIIGYLRYKKLTSVCEKYCNNRTLDYCVYALGMEEPPELIQLKKERSELIELPNVSNIH